MNRNAVQVSPFAFLCSEKLIAHRIVDDARNNLPILRGRERRSTPLESHGHTEKREAVREIRRAVQWIDIPAVFEIDIRVRALCAVAARRGKYLVHPLDDQLLGSTSRVRH